MAEAGQHAIEAVSTVAGKVTGGTSLGLVVYGGYTAQEWGVIAGIGIALLGLAIQSITNWYFKKEMLKLEQKRLDHELKQD